MSNNNRKSRGKSKNWKSSPENQAIQKSTNINAPANCNDIDWYVHDATEAKQIASLPFSFAAGITNEVSGLEFNPAAVCVADVVPMYGTSDSPNSAMNIGIRRNFAETRKANSGSANYTSTFEGMYMLTFDSIYYLMSHIRRAFSIYHTYSTWNRYYPKAVLNAMGFSFDDIAKNFPQYIARYNNVIRAISVWNIPDTWPIFKRHSFLFGAALIDSKDPKDQAYYYRPAGYYKFIEINTDEDAVGSKLEWYPLVYNDSGTVMSYSVSYWLDIVEDLLAAVISSSTAQILNGDIAKAFGDHTYKVSLITGEEPLVLIDDDMAREQFMNAMPVGEVFNLNVTERIDPNNPNEDLYLVVRPQIYNKVTDTNTDSILLTTYNHEPTPEHIIEATRFMVPCTYNAAASDAAPIYIEGPMSDVVSFVHMITLDDIAETTLTDTQYQYVERVNYQSNAFVQDELPGFAANIELFKKWNYFDYAPRFIFSLSMNQPGESAEPMWEQINVKLSNYTVVNRDTLTRINNIAIQKLFGF